MRNYAFGEWILSLITARDRAASIVGDMIESRCSALRFWAGIGSHLLHAITPAVIRMALAGFIAQFVLLIPLALAIALAYMFGRAVLGLPLPIYLFGLGAGFACFGIQTLIGYWFGRYSSHRALLVCLMVGLVDCALGALNWRNASINMAVWSIPLLVGAIAGFRRSSRYA